MFLRALLLIVAIGTCLAADPVPVAVQSAPGRFEIAAVDASLAHAVTAEAEAAWRHLAAPLGLPAAFPSPVFARIVSDGEVEGPPFRVMVEPGGVVSLRLHVRGTPLTMVRRALVQALLMRLAVALHGASDRLAVPLWLEHACVIWWETHAEPAQQDALKQEIARGPVPSLAAVLHWRRGADEPRALITGAGSLLAFLQAESGRAGEWPALRQRLLAGDDPDLALALAFPARFANAEERELWWQTGWHHLARLRAGPAMIAAESRAQLGALARFVFATAADETDRVVPLTEMVARAAEPIVAVDLSRRQWELGRLIPALHPFYRNAGLSLAEALRGAAAKKPAQREAACRAFEQDWNEAVELEAASKAALDRLEGGAGAP